MEKKLRPKRDTYSNGRTKNPPLKVDNLTIDVDVDGRMLINVTGTFVTDDIIQVATIRNRLSAILEIMKKNPAALRS